jgi:transposase-like protein
MQDEPTGPPTDESISKRRSPGLTVVPRRPQATGNIGTSTPATVFSAKKQEAIEALLLPGSIEDVARQTGITTKKLSLWMKDPEFMAALGAARRADHRQSIASLGHGPDLIIKSLLYIMYHGKKAAARLKAARHIIRLADEANEFEEFLAGVADAERLSSGRPPKTGHGGKLPRRQEQAIVALIEQRSVAEAARTIDVKPQTLRLWMKDPAFNSKYAVAACAVYGSAMMLAQQRVGDAAVVIRNISTDSAVPEETRLKAVIYRAGVLQGIVNGHLGTRVSGMEPGGAGTNGPQVTSQVIGIDLHQRLQQIKSRLLHASGQSGIRRIMLVHSADGRAAGSSVKGPDGLHHWFDPPEGFRKGDLITNDPTEEYAIPLRDVAA